MLLIPNFQLNIIIATSYLKVLFSGNVMSLIADSNIFATNSYYEIRNVNAFNDLMK